MAFKVDTLVELLSHVAITTLSDISESKKNVLFDRFYPDRAAIEEAILGTSVEFAPGLFEIFQSKEPPTVTSFKTLPTNVKKRWGVYMVLLEKSGQRPRVYIGSSTNADRGVAARLSNYNNWSSLPRFVLKAREEGFTVSYKGLLCWTAMPPAAKIPRTRMVLLLLEGTLAFMLWTMRTINYDWGMSHICLWDRTSLEYDGLCSHPCFYEAIIGDFDLSEEDLEALAAERKRIRASVKSEYGSNVHYEQMATNYDEYSEKNAAFRAAGRAKDGGEYHRQNARDNAAKHHALKTHYCEMCKRSFPTAHMLKRHNKGKNHINKAKELATKRHKCDVCAMAFDHRGTFNVHLKGKRHLKKAAEAAAAEAAALSS